ncbi:Tn3 family transposase [Nocardia sp. NPDC001965]
MSSRRATITRFWLEPDYPALQQCGGTSTHWQDMCWAAVSIYSGEVSGHDVTRMIFSRDGCQTRWARPSCTRKILRNLHIPAPGDDELYQYKTRPRPTSPKDATTWHGGSIMVAKGETVRANYEGIKGRLSALGLVLSCLALWNTAYSDRALEQLSHRAVRSTIGTLPGCRRSSATELASTGTTPYTCPT